MRVAQDLVAQDLHASNKDTLKTPSEAYESLARNDCCVNH